MKAKMLMALVLTAALSATASAQYRGYGRYGGGYGRGLGGFGPTSIISSLGQYNVSSSQAAVNYENAYSQYLDNRKKYQATYFDMRRNWISWRSEMRAPPPTELQVAAYNTARLPKPLSPSEFDPGHGVLHWPPVLRHKDFDDDRHRLEGLLTEAAADAQNAGLGTENYRAIQRSIDCLHGKLRTQIGRYSPDAYIAAQKFLKSLSHQARSPLDRSVAVR